MATKPYGVRSVPISCGVSPQGAERMNENRLWKSITLGFVACAMLADCGGRSGSSSSGEPGVSVTVPPAPTVFLMVGGNVSGLSGTVVLHNNGTDALTISGDGR